MIKRILTMAVIAVSAPVALWTAYAAGHALGS